MVKAQEHEQPDKKPIQYHKRPVASQWVLQNEKSEAVKRLDISKDIL